MSGFQVLSRAERQALGEAGAVKITREGELSLNQLLALWLTAEDENRRQKRVDALVKLVSKNTMALEELLSEDSLDAQEFRRRVLKFVGSDQLKSFDEALGSSRALNLAFKSMPPMAAGPGQPKQDWIFPYLAAVMSIHSRLGGDNRLPSTGQDDAEATRPLYGFARAFSQIVLERTNRPDSTLPETTRTFAQLAAKKGGSLTQFMHRCRNEFSSFPDGFNERTLLLLTEGAQSEFRELINGKAFPSAPLSAGGNVTASDKIGEIAKSVYARRNEKRE